jgi:ABC-type sugar transport system permease subunit
MYIIWVIIPIFQSLLFSFTARDSILFPDYKFIGFDNFVRLFQDPIFGVALKNNLIWMLSFVIFPLSIGLGIAMLFNNAYPGTKLLKTLFYIPMTLSYAVIGSVWAWIYNPDVGVLNVFLRSIGLSAFARPWIGDPQYMTYALVAVGIWRQVPYIMILYTAGLKNIPTEMLEASYVDGANWWQRFRYIIVPLLRPATIIAITVLIIDSLRVYDIVYIMTNTRARAAETLASYMYSSAFTYQDYGYGSAIAVIQFLITFAFILFYIKSVVKNEGQE